MAEQNTFAPELLQALREAAPGGHINCEAARALAEQLGVDYAVIGEAANELGIKVKSCQLGCFK